MRSVIIEVSWGEFGWIFVDAVVVGDVDPGWLVLDVVDC